MILLVSLLVGLAVGAWNTWQRLGRSPRARAWSRGMRADVPRNVLVLWPLFAIACVLGAVVGLAPDDPTVYLSVLLLAVSLLALVAYFLLPLPIPGFVKPSWYRRQTERKSSSRG